MKTILSLLIGLTILSCNQNGDKSDAFGNFESTEITISAETSGKVMSMNFNEGDVLVMNHTLCTIDTISLYLQKVQLLATRNAAKTGLEKVYTTIEVQKAQKNMIQNDLNRLIQLKESDAATDKQLEDAKGQITVIERQIDNTNAQIATILSEMEVVDTKIASINDQIARCKITMPKEGTILNKLVELGELVTPGKPIAKIADLKTMELRAYISGDMLPQLSVGQSVKVLIDEDSKSNKSYTGTITWISALAEFTPKIIQTKKERVNQVYAFKVKVINDGSIKIGMPGEVLFK